MPVGSCPNLEGYLNDIHSISTLILGELHEACVLGGLESKRQSEVELAPNVMRPFYVSDIVFWCQQMKSSEMFTLMDSLGHCTAEINKMRGLLQVDIAPRLRSARKRTRA